MMFRLSGHLVTARDFANRDAVFGLSVFRHQLIQNPANVGSGLLQTDRNLIGRQRLVRQVDDGFDDRGLLWLLWCGFLLWPFGLEGRLYFAWFHSI